jgi:hypothetical protein
MLEPIGFTDSPDLEYLIVRTKLCFDALFNFCVVRIASVKPHPFSGLVVEFTNIRG